MDYITQIEFSSRSFSQGRGTSSTKPKEELSLEQVLDYLDEHPNDCIMLKHLKNMVESQGEPVVRQIAERFKEKPTAATFGALAKTDIGKYPWLKDLILGMDREMLLGFYTNHPLLSIRGLTSIDRFALNMRWEDVFRQNRLKHKPFAAIEITLGVPEDLVIAAMNMPEHRHVKEFAESAGSSSVRSGTSLRTVPVEETYQRLEKLGLENILTTETAVGYGFCGTYLIATPWKMKLAVSAGRNSYTIEGIGGASGKGLDKAAAHVSGLMEMIERYSSHAGCTPDFPKGYKKLQEMRKARRSELIAEGTTIEVFDPNSLSLSIPYNDEELYWVVGERVTEEGRKPVYVPAQAVYLMSNFDEVEVFETSSNGLASGNTMDEAKLHVLMEIVERDGDYSVFYSPEKVFALSAEEGKIAEVIGRYMMRGLNIQLLDLTSEFGVPTYRAFVQTDGQILSGSGTHLDGRIAAARAICELSPKCFAWEKSHGEVWKDVSPLVGSRVEQYEMLPNYSSGNVELDLRVMENLLTANGYEIFYVDLTREDTGIPVVRAIVPGLELPDGISTRQMAHFIKDSGVRVAGMLKPGQVLI